MLIILPWWCLQAYEAYLPNLPGQFEALKIAWRRAHDIRYLGGLFLFTAVTDSYIIWENPEYILTLFCAKPTGITGVLAKAQSPFLHTAIGYGFLKLYRWAFFVYLAYAGFGIVNATVNYSCFGFGRIRTTFFISLLAFTAYVIWRRKCFGEKHNTSLPWLSFLTDLTFVCYPKGVLVKVIDHGRNARPRRRKRYSICHTG